jgi:WD40 repeat protein
MKTLNTLPMVWSLGHTNYVSSVSFSPDGARIVSGSWDYTVWMWDVATRQPLGELLRGHISAISSASFSPDGARIVTSLGTLLYGYGMQ